VHIFEKYIKRYPQEYLWTYKIWKYGQEKNILILDDGKVGHLRQAQSLANIARQYLKERGINVRLHTVEIKFKSGLANTALAFSSLLAGKYHCQGCLWCLRTFLRDEVYKNLIASRPDVVISCGSSVAPINYVLSRENLARSVVIMRPSLLSVNRFNLVIMPRHDNPPRRKNIVVTDGALNLIDDEYLAEKSRDLIQASGGRLQASSFYFGLLLGGDTKNFKLKADVMLEVARQIKSAAEKFNAGILVTTSRRTSKETEELVKREFGDYRNCKLLIIANEKNIPEAVGGILGLSKVVVVSPESISMVSEAASSGRHTLAFEAEVSPKHRNFLNHLSRNGYIHFIQAEKIADSIARISSERSPAKVLRDGDKVREALGRII
jgi:mitochondrial fission protein ELM1